MIILLSPTATPIVSLVERAFDMILVDAPVQGRYVQEDESHHGMGE